MTNLRGVPSVDQLLQTRQAVDLIADYGRGLLWKPFEHRWIATGKPSRTAQKTLKIPKN